MPNSEPGISGLSLVVQASFASSRSTVTKLVCRSRPGARSTRVGPSLSSAGPPASTELTQRRRWFALPRLATRTAPRSGSLALALCCRPKVVEPAPTRAAPLGARVHDLRSDALRLRQYMDLTGPLPRLVSTLNFGSHKATRYAVLTTGFFQPKAALRR
jgi:hypothetical protein